jgi:glycosyltransferase involved in cell wall biosynthesis
VEQTISAKNLETFPLVSITIPIFNSGNTLAETLDSVLGQTYPNIEVICVDDGSTDNSLDVLSHYDDRVRVIRKTNGGLASARNACCHAAQGKYIALMDADDICMPERIAMQVSYMEQNPGIVMCSSDFAAFNMSGPIANSYIANYYSLISETPGGLTGIYSRQEVSNLAGHEVITLSGKVYELLALGSFIHPPTVLFSRKILDECGLFDEHIPNLCDFEWFLRLSRVGEIAFIDESLLNYRFSEEQLSGPHNMHQMVLDIVQVMEKTRATDPAIIKRNPLYSRYLGNAYLDAANSHAEKEPLAAIIKLIRSLTFGVLRLQTLKVLCKVFIPRYLLQWKRDRYI